MKHWPLRWQIAFYAASLGVIATLAGAATTWTLMHYWEMRNFDARLTHEGERLLETFATTSTEQLSRNVIVHPPDRLVRLQKDDGEIRYQSPRADALPTSVASASTATIDGHKYRLLILTKNGLRLTIAGDLAEIYGLGRDIVFGMFGAIPTVLIVVLLGGRWVAQRALGPVEAIQQAAAQITPRNLHQRLPLPPTQDEIAALVSVLNQTFDRLQRSFEQSVRFSADASHHLKTPIAILRAGIEEMLRDPATPPEHQARADALLHQTHHLTSIAENLLLLARADAGRLDLNLTNFDLKELLDGVGDDLHALSEAASISAEIKLAETLPVRADRFAISLVIQNLIDNAVKFNRRGGRVRLSASRRDDHIQLAVGNTGQRIAADRAAHIFERFARASGNSTTAGHGLGLSIAQELVAAHGGELTLQKNEADWIEFVLLLPAADQT